MINKNDQSKIESVLRNLGLNQTEQAVYLESLESGPTSVQQLAKKTGINRVTVHSAVNQLLTKGFMFETRKGKRRLVVAERGKSFNNFIAQRKQELLALESELSPVQKIIESITPSLNYMPDVRIYDDASGFKKMLEESLKAKSEMVVFSYVDLLAEIVGPLYLEGYFQRRAKKNISSRLIFPQSEFAQRIANKKSKYNAEVRFLSKDFNWNSGIFAWDNTAALLSYTKNRLTCTIVENEAIANFYRTIVFDLCWSGLDDNQNIST